MIIFILQSTKFSEVNLMAAAELPQIGVGRTFQSGSGLPVHAGCVLMKEALFLSVGILIIVLLALWPPRDH